MNIDWTPVVIMWVCVMGVWAYTVLELKAVDVIYAVVTGLCVIYMSVHVLWVYWR